ncbi:2Fe-2S iron-sulfur cluster-binding protein [Amycolatopsis panacis]|uniref:2Fe-2S iron-sulfur cluster-binding protein n=1 Tax=Amycolatopsis panacis TaxID=2340917 RepID=UPI0026C4611E|nr:2Fe-2S iron-sulfur cluster-binding protein [Amycolatopsis panacis]
MTVRGPRNAFPFVAAAAYHFVAGGIGITPIPPMVPQAAAHGADWQLVYTGRDRASMPFAPDLPYSCRQGFCGTCAVPTADGGQTRVPAVLDL